MKKMMTEFKRVLSGERPWKDIIHYNVGNYRYALYYSAFRFLLRRHIKEQISFRILFMREECYNSGSCVMCGCMTTALQMANKTCDDKCYPPMMNRYDWKKFYHKELFYLDFKTRDIWIYNKNRNKLSLHSSDRVFNNQKTDYDVSKSKARFGSLKSRL